MIQVASDDLSGSKQQSHAVVAVALIAIAVIALICS